MIKLILKLFQIATQEKLSNTAILSSENKLKKKADFENIIDEFVSIKARKLK